MKAKLSILGFVGVLMVACATLGSFNGQVITANNTIEEASELVGTLYTAGKITLEEKDKRNEGFARIAGAIDATVALHKTNPEVAEEKLDNIINGLRLTIAALEEKKHE